MQTLLGTRTQKLTREKAALNRQVSCTPVAVPFAAAPADSALFSLLASRLRLPGLHSDSSLLFPLLIAKPANWKPVLRLPQHICELKSANVDP